MLSEDARVLGCVIHPSMYRDNDSSVGWIGPHTNYSNYSLLLWWNGESMCDFTLSSGGDRGGPAGPLAPPNIQNFCIYPLVFLLKAP
jgi:hypothetical protein